MYYYGKGVPQDYAEAGRWCRKAADQNYPTAQDALGYSYYMGLGVPQDYTQAFFWYQRAAEQGYAKAEFDLASLYFSGKGVTQNYAEARRWYIRSAKHGSAEAQYSLKLLGLESSTVTKLEYVELLTGLPLGLWLLLDFVLRGRNPLNWRQAFLMLLGLVFLSNAALSLYVITQGGMRYCSYPVALHIARRVLLGTAIVIIATMVFATKKSISEIRPMFDGV
jgi:hypothetical protein